MLTPKPLLKIISSLKKHRIDVLVNETEINISICLKTTHFDQIKPLLYLLLNKFEESYFITLEGIPPCLMKDAQDHLVYKENPSQKHIKDEICQKCHYYNSCPGWTQDSKIENRPSEIIHRPKEIVFELTNRCHLACQICFRPNRKLDMPLDMVKSYIDDCVRLGIRDVRFTGGEPLLYKHINEALLYAKEKNRYVIVNTTATLLTPELKSVLIKCADNLLISLQGFDPKSNQRLTKSNGKDFPQKLKNIIELNHLIKEVRLGTIISQTLVHNLKKYHHLVKSLGVKYWEMYRGMSPDQSGDFAVGPDDLIKIMTFMHQNKNKRKEILIANPVPFCIIKDMNISRNVLYGAQSDDGHSRLILDVDGFLKPSYLINKNLGTTIEEAWNHPFLQKMKTIDYLPKQCQECSSLTWCKGGSRYWSNLVNKDYYDKDPLMNYEENMLKCAQSAS